MKENELRNGTIDAIWNGYSPTAERAQKVAFSRQYLQNAQILVTKKQITLTRQLRCKEKS